MKHVSLLLMAVVLLLAPVRPARGVEEGPSADTARLYLPLMVRPASPPLSGDAIAAALSAIQTRFEAMPGVDKSAERHDLANFIRALPSMAAAGVAKDGSVWGRFRDGRMLTIPVTLPDQSAAGLTPSPLPPSSPASSQEGLPATDTAYALNAMGSCFPDAATPIASWLTARGYAVAPIQPTVEGLKTVHDAGVLYLDGHGGVAESVKGERYAMWTSTPWALAGDFEFFDDIVAGRLVYMLALNDLDTAGTACVASWHYAITDLFVSNYLTLAPASFVFFNGCSGMSADANVLRQAFAQKGASVYVGWTDPVGDYSSWVAVQFVFDRLLGANAFRPETPPQRPFYLYSVYQDLVKRHLDSSPSECEDGRVPCLAYLRYERLNGDANQDFYLLAPSLDAVLTRQGVIGRSESPMVLVAFGLFGDAPGKITVQGQELQVLTWMTNTISAVLPASGAASAGEVVVSVRGHASNPVPLTEWRGHLHWREDYAMLVPAPGLYAEVDCQIQLRSDYHAFRDDAGDPPTAFAEVSVTGGQDSSCTWQMHGVATWTAADSGDAMTGVLSGSGEAAWRSPYAPPGPYVNPGGLIDTAAPKMQMAVSVGRSQGELAVYRDGVLQNTDPVSLLGSGILTIPMKANGDLPAGTSTYNLLQGTITATWEAMTARFAPGAEIPVTAAGR
jgi:hypothetical protein